MKRTVEENALRAKIKAPLLDKTARKLMSLILSCLGISPKRQHKVYKVVAMHFGDDSMKKNPLPPVSLMYRYRTVGLGEGALVCFGVRHGTATHIVTESNETTKVGNKFGAMVTKAHQADRSVKRSSFVYSKASGFADADAIYRIALFIERRQHATHFEHAW